jgi:hypothetical protein
MNLPFLLLAVEQSDKAFWPTGFAENWLAVAAAVGAVFAFFHALHQYKEGLHWKRTRFLGKQFAKFRSDPKVATAYALLDSYEKRTVYLSSDGKKPATQKKEVSPADVVVALSESDTDNSEFYDAIRDAFDSFFDGLERLECFIVAEAIEEKHLSNLLKYWVQQFADAKESSKGTEFVKAARCYVGKWYPGEVQSLCNRFGCGFETKQ